MRQRRILVVLAITLGLGAPREAAAFCELLGPYLGTGPQLPSGCPLHAYLRVGPFDPGPLDPVRITALRGGEYVDVTGSIMRADVVLRVQRMITECDGVTRPQDNNEPYDRVAVQPVGVNVGDRIGLGTGWLSGIEIVPAGTCAAPIEPTPSCAEIVDCSGPPVFDDFGPGTCAAGGGGGGLALGLVALGLAVRRRHRRR